ncbi:CRISPR-associated endonuclease Cas2 [Bacteroides salyersiae]|jgi:CRISPR-associated protein Cas2|uniref:CRISPR-associated endonuclease Cas2 n=1 Tax=Bacteroides salyersiae TaxID=291644 RepID=UPI001C8CD0EB|nr:CRISPR-associated endonuclease Cas2 [Bacteroides salyersiae]
MARAKKTFCVVAYDIKEDRKRARVSKILERYGIRVNFSVFECMFTDIQLLQVQEKIKKILDKRSDTVIYYPICVNCYTKIIYQPAHRQTPRIIEIV